MSDLGDIIADELANPSGRSLQQRLLQAMFLMERFRGVDAGWREVVPEIGEVDFDEDAINRLAQALRTFIKTHRDHSDVSTAIWALGALRAEEDAALFDDVLRDESGYCSFAREQAQFAVEAVRP